MSDYLAPYIIENHKTLVALLLQMDDEDSEQARGVRRAVKKGNERFSELEKIYIQMMADKEKNGTGAEGQI